MSCNEYQLQMSLCLDGRLPAGSRASVLAHIASCGDCDRVWDDLQKAQDLVLNLPVQKTSRDFRQTLWARIEAGEGAPEVKFVEPVSLMTKARYVIAGAAAAALMLVCGKLLLSGDLAGSGVSTGSQVATAPGQSSPAKTTPLHPKDPGNATISNADLVAFNPYSLTRQVTERTAQSIRKLRSQLCTDSSTLPQSFMEPEMRAAVAELRDSIELVRFLQDTGVVVAIPPEIDSQLRSLTRLVQNSDSSKQVQAEICRVGQLEQLTKQVSVSVVDSRSMLDRFQTQLDLNPGMKRMFTFQVSPFDGGGETGEVRVMIRLATQDFPTRR